MPYSLGTLRKFGSRLDSSQFAVGTACMNGFKLFGISDAQDFSTFHSGRPTITAILAPVRHSRGKY